MQIFADAFDIRRHFVYVYAQLFKSCDMYIYGALPDFTSARIRNFRTLKPSQHRTEHKNRRTYAFGKFFIHGKRLNIRTANFYIIAVKTHTTAHAHYYLRHFSNICYVRAIT